MNIAVDQIIHGFRTVSAQRSDEMNCMTYSFIHEKTGARVFWLDNHEENKVFSIAFRTLPDDDTGVFHILEHSVLCGSERFPVREPFVELMKSSMNTFLNAMTFQDMTMYPVASRNNKDLLNLASVYLDAVFRPAILKNELIFLQEGWHIEKDDEGNYQYKGVVLNEMKGAMSDTDAQNEQKILSMLFPDNGYGRNSGGNPVCITDLTYNHFIEEYKRHYHPSNAYVYLDGDIPFDDILTMLDAYMKEYDRCDDLPSFRMQEAVSENCTDYYELGREEETLNKGHLTIGRLLGTWCEKEKNMAAGIVADVLTGNNEAPLKRRILQNGLAQDINLIIDDSGFQSWFCIHAENVTDGKENDVLDAVRECGETILREGLDHDALEASLNRMAYCLKEEDEPQGISRCIRVMGSWLYDGEPLYALENSTQVERLREMIGNGEIDRLASDMLLNCEGQCILRMYPSKELGDKRRENEKERLLRITENWTTEETEKNSEYIEKLRRWQQTEDTEEDLATLPVLTKEDADVKPEWTATDVIDANGVKVLYHKVYCSGIVHMRAYFSLTDYSLKDLTRISQMCSMLGKLPTKQHDALTLQQEIKRYTGKLGFSVIVRNISDDSKTCTPYLVAATSVLENNLEKAKELLKEILTETLFDSDDRIMEIIRQNEMGARQRIVGAGHAIAVRNVLSHFSAEQAVRNALEGDDAVRYIHEFSVDPAQELCSFRMIAEKVLSETFCRKRMTVSITADKAYDMDQWIFSFTEGSPVCDSAEYHTDKPVHKGYRIPSQTGFAARGYRLDQCGQKFTGTMWLAGNILSLSYLWNRVRVQGGAYGAGFQIDRTGNMFTYSFRDPTPVKSLNADFGAAAFMREFSENSESLDKYIISSLNELNPLLSAKEKGALADARYLSGYTEEDAERIRQEVLHTTYDDLEKCETWLKKFVSEGATCIVASQDKFTEDSDLQISDL